MAYKHIEIPEDGEQITITDSGELNVPQNPIIPFIEGDGIGTDVTAAAVTSVPMPSPSIKGIIGF